MNRLLTNAPCCPKCFADVHVASKGAKDVQHKYKEKKSKKNGEEAGEDGDAADTGAEIDVDAGPGTDTETEPETLPAEAP